MTQRLRDKLKFYSQIKYFLWKTLAPFYSYDLKVKMKSGISIIIRPHGKSRYGNFSDLCTGYEVFVAEAYKLPKEIRIENVTHIIDIGGNVGYSCLYWLHKFPNSRVVVIEPHPKHIEKIYAHLKINQYEERVVVIPSAAGSKVGSIFLTDMGASSKLTNEQSENTISVQMIDWFKIVGDQEIDILKIDIEGGEYDLLSDPRFADIKFKLMVMEWHNTSQHPDGYEWCMNRLKELNYRTMGEKGIDSYCGIIFAFP